MKIGDLVTIRDGFAGSLTLFNDDGSWCGDFRDPNMGIVLELSANYLERLWVHSNATDEYVRIIVGSKIGWFRAEFLKIIS